MDDVVAAAVEISRALYAVQKFPNETINAMDALGE
jgi:hypothetical protein